MADSDLRKCGIQGKWPMNDNQATTSCLLLDFNLTAYRLFLFLYRSPTLGGRTSYIAKHEVHNEYGGTYILYGLLAGGVELTRQQAPFATGKSSLRDPTAASNDAGRHTKHE